MGRVALWTVHGDGKHVAAGDVVAPDERLDWLRTTGIGAQHVVAMFGATFLVPLLTGFPPATTLLFSGLGTLLFLVITGNRLPSYLGSSFAFIAPVTASKADGGVPEALGGIVLAGVGLAVVGMVVQVVGSRWVDVVMPPVVTGAIVALIGLNLAPTAKNSFEAAPVTAFVTLLAVLLLGVLFRGLLGRLSIFLGVLVGYAVAAVRGELDFDPVRAADWVGLPDLTAPHFSFSVVGLFLPVVLVLVAENVGHVKAVAAMTGRPMDDVVGRALIGDGAATALAGVGGGSATTTYAENIGVMAATRVYSTAAYWIAGVIAVLLSLSPKFGALIATIPAGVLGGATTVLYGLIGILGARIWVEARVDFKDPANLFTAAVALVVGIADYTWTLGDVTLGGIALGSLGAVAAFHVLTFLGRRTGTAGYAGGGGHTAAETAPTTRPPSASGTH
ncbi:uracil-xanthine permease family protein [Motilibacter deserti]|uniref:Nitrate reductase n=1 Tax=Motilibacter deserti TaxID=2714956 RepID=A0ABX0GZ78_9ACTN|nr:nitrate reductase [Motilibacter deserti]